MSNKTPALKRHNHRVHPCKDEKKESLLSVLLEKNSDKEIVVIGSTKLEINIESKNVRIMNDEELNASPELECDMIISYDLPLKAEQYIQRTTHSKTHALILVNPDEEKRLYQVETLLGRTIMQEFIEGFSEVPVSKQAQPTKKDADPREERKRKFLDDGKQGKKSFKDKKPYDEKKKKPWSDKAKKPHYDDGESGQKPWEKKAKKENKYLGKDENGKAIFSGKSGERNHAYDGTPKAKAPKLTGKKINISALKKKD